MQVVGGELGSDAAPGECQTGADHRDRRGGAAHDADDVRRRRQHRQHDQHERDRLVARVRSGVGRGAQRRPEHTEHDRGDRHVLAPARVLMQHPPAEPEQHEQPCRQCRLHDHQRHQQQRHQLQWPAEHRDAGSEQPARPADQIARQPQAQVLGVRRALGVHRLQHHP